MPHAAGTDTDAPSADTVPQTGDAAPSQATLYRPLFLSNPREREHPLEANFADRWKDYLARTGFEEMFFLIKLAAPDDRLSEEASRFLVETGMPDAAGLSFDDLTKGLRKVYDVYSPYDSNYWNDSDRERLASYLILGSDMGGNPVCLDLANQERVVLLDHERHFEVSYFVNSGVSQLAECILVFQETVETYRLDKGEDAELDEGNVPASLVQQALRDMGRSDPSAVGENCYWPAALDYL